MFDIYIMILANNKGTDYRKTDDCRTNRVSKTEMNASVQEKKYKHAIGYYYNFLLWTRQNANAAFNKATDGQTDIKHEKD